MHKLNRIIGLAALGLALSAAGGCKKKKGTTNPDSPAAKAAAAAALDPTKASAEAKKDFAEVAKRYEAAKKDGELSSAQCDQYAKDFEKVYKKHGKQMTVAYFNAGAVWDECGNTEKAEQIYLAITKAVPKYDLSYNNLGVIYWNRKQESKALNYFKKAVEANIATRAPRNNLAAALRDKYSNSPEQGTFAEAERTLQRVLAVDSSNQLAYENLARLYYDRGRLKDKSYLLLCGLVIDQANRVLKEEGIESADLFNLQGLLHMEEDDQVAALRAFKKAAELNPKHADAHMNMALIAIRFRDYGTAEESLTVAIKDQRQKKNVEAYLGLGVAQRGLRKYKEAEKAFKKAEDLSKSDPRALYNLGILYHEHIAATQEEFSKTPYTTAKDYYNKFVAKAGGKQDYAAQVEDAKNRMGAIEQLFKDIEEMKKLEEEQKKMMELEKKQQEEEKKRLLELEAKARAAAGGGGGGGDAGGGDAKKE